MIRYRYRVIYNRVPRIAAELHPLAARIVRKTALDLEAGIKASLQGQGHGEWYGNHQASAPGDPPAIDTGALANSVQAYPITPTHWRVAVNADYGVYLEYGTVHMEPRPFVEPQVDEIEPVFYGAMRNLERGLR